MNANATAISLDYDQVKIILQDWLNANLLRTPHQVTEVDYFSDELHAGQFSIFNITLAPIAPAPVVATGNGKEVKPPAQPAAAPKKRTATTRISDDARWEIFNKRKAGAHPKTIVEQYGISEATVYAIVAEHRSNEEATHAA